MNILHVIPCYYQQYCFTYLIKPDARVRMSTILEVEIRMAQGPFKQEVMQRQLLGLFVSCPPTSGRIWFQGRPLLFTTRPGPAQLALPFRKLLILCFFFLNIFMYL